MYIIEFHWKLIFIILKSVSLQSTFSFSQLKIMFLRSDFEFIFIFIIIPQSYEAWSIMLISFFNFPTRTFVTT